MSFYIPLSIKYRPKYLSDIIGQDIFVDIINYIIKTQKLYYVYIFSGTRGVGKTTLARIIAKTINCENIIFDNALEAKKNLVKNCEICASCLTNAAFDIIEIDAASNTGVDNIREVIDASSYIPTAKYKVFIIDEVHMLSKNAFNAFLKTLEEPKTNVIFILATTEIEKIPLTILSRCQRFDLKEINILDLEKLLIKICKLENIQYEKNALSTIAKLANGSARDAISFLEQANSYINSQNDINIINKLEINNQILNNLFSIISKEKIFSIIFAIFNKDITLIFETIKNINIYSLTINLLDMLSMLMKVKILNSNKLSIQNISNITNLDDINLINNIIKLSESISLHQLTNIWKILIKHLYNIKLIENKIAYFEMLILLIIENIAIQPAIENIATQPVIENIATQPVIGPNIMQNAQTTMPIKFQMPKEELKEILTEETKQIDQQKKEVQIQKVPTEIRPEVQEVQIQKVSTEIRPEVQDLFHASLIEKSFAKIESNATPLLSNIILNTLITSLNNNFEFEIYYFLMNYCSIILKDKIVEVYIANNDIILIRKMKTVLNAYSFAKFQFFIKNDITNLKSTLLKEASLSSNINIIKNNFHNYKIIDILFEA